MILPAKHVRFSESLLGLGGLLLRHLEKPATIEELWFWLDDVNKSEVLPTYHPFDNVVLALDFLYAMGLINLCPTGKISREAS